jgi:L-2-hydroxyglutarate oxidase LhgO
MLAFGREAYRFWEVSLRDMGGLVSWPGFHRLLADRAFRELIRSEVRKSLSLREMWKEVMRLVPALEVRDLVRSFAGNRAQVVSRDGRLIDDIIIRETPNTVHVLNVVSPGLTCSLPFGAHLADLCLSKLEST